MSFGGPPAPPMAPGQGFSMEAPPVPTVAPQDLELRHRIEKMAEYINRNGPSFENMMQQKQQGNPAFGFLFPGTEYHAFFRWAIHCMRNGWGPDVADQMARQHASQLQGVPAPQQAAPQQAGLAAHDLAEFKALLDGLTRSKDSIRAGKEWVLAHAYAADAVTAELRSRTSHPMASFDTRLNLVYLVSDVLFNCIKQEGVHKDSMSAALSRDLVYILREAYQQQPEADQQKVMKVVDLWLAREVLDPAFVNQLKLGMTSSEAPPRPGAAPMSSPAPQQPAYQPPGPAVSTYQPPARSRTSFSMSATGPPTSLSSNQPMSQPSSQFMPAPAPAGSGPSRLAPEKVPIGLVVSAMSRGAAPYTPLNPHALPTSLPPKRTPSMEVLDALKSFYAQLKDGSDKPREKERRARSRSRSPPRRRGKSRSRSRSRSPIKDRFAPAPSSSSRGGAAMQMERPGLGMGGGSAPKNSFDSFRNKNSGKYHDRLAATR